MIREPLLRERLLMDDAAFDAFLLRTFAEVGSRPFCPADHAHAAGYPWLSSAPSPVPGALSGRLPLLAIGSNAAPEVLHRKLAPLPPDARSVPVSVGELHDLDVGVAAHPTGYGSLPATLFASPGTRVRVAVQWVTPRQLEQLCWTELTYRLGRLDGARFVAASDGSVVRRPLVFASRFGAFRPAGVPVALAAIPARARSSRALSQAELLDLAAAIALGEGRRGPDLVEALFTDPVAFASGPGRRLRATGRPLPAAGWTPWAG